MGISTSIYYRSPSRFKFGMFHGSDVLDLDGSHYLDPQRGEEKRQDNQELDIDPIPSGSIQESKSIQLYFPKPSFVFAPPKQPPRYSTKLKKIGLLFHFWQWPIWCGKRCLQVFNHQCFPKQLAAFEREPQQHPLVHYKSGGNHRNCRIQPYD